MPVLQPLDVVNAACGRIGVDPLQSLGEETIGGQAADLTYETVIRSLLGVYPFSWSREIRQLAKLAGDPALAGLPFSYQLPTDRLGPPLRVIDDPLAPDRGFSRYQLSGDLVLSDIEPLWAEISILPPPARWSTAFLEAATLVLAGELALALAHDKTLRQQLREDAMGTSSVQPRGGLMGAAISADGRATPPRRLQPWNPLADAWAS